MTTPEGAFVSHAMPNVTFHAEIARQLSVHVDALSLYNIEKQGSLQLHPGYPLFLLTSNNNSKGQRQLKQLQHSH